MVCMERMRQVHIFGCCRILASDSLLYVWQWFIKRVNRRYQHVLRNTVEPCSVAAMRLHTCAIACLVRVARLNIGHLAFSVCVHYT